MTPLSGKTSGKLVSELEALRPGQVRELWRFGDELLEVSTVPDTSGGLGPVLDEFLGLLGGIIGPGDPAAEYAVDRDPEAEETMAFRCDAHGHRINSIHVVAAQGDGSRARVLEMLSAGQRWPWPAEADQ